MNFWKVVFSLGFGADFIRKAVITTDNPFGEITKEEFKTITGEDFIKVVSPTQPITTEPGVVTNNPIAPPVQTQVSNATDVNTPIQPTPQVITQQPTTV